MDRLVFGVDLNFIPFFYGGDSCNNARFLRIANKSD
jgi:hypothetical protein